MGQSADVIVTKYDDGLLWINKADAVALISDEMLNQLADNGLAGEGLFVVQAENGTVRYRLVGRDLVMPWVWVAERITDWPDEWSPAPQKGTQR